MNGMQDISIHVIDTETVRSADCRLLESRMPGRYAKAMRYRFERDRLLCLGAGLLMMDVLGIRDEEELRFGPFGKPYAPGRQTFSISHSGSRCILACGGEAQIGADLEEIKPRHLDLAKRVFTGNEQIWMAEDPEERFFMLWTWKESVMKATGMGMTLTPESFEVLPFAEGKPVRIADRNWYAWGGRLAQSRVGVCLEEPFGQVRLVEYRGSAKGGSG